MFSLAAPLWLLGLLGVPLVRWLHRYSRQDQVHQVAALFLWRPAAGPERRGRRRGPPDPRWRLRALLLAALVLALARPILEQAGPRGIEVWIDDSPSLQTLEQDRTRLQRVLDRLDEELIERGAKDVWLRSLRNPTLRVRWRSDSLPTWQAHWRTPDPLAAPNPQPPPAAVMAEDREHWLVTDGADAGLNAWAASAPLSHILREGTARDNVAITRLAVRPALPDGTTLALVSLHNLSDRAMTRQLVLYADGRELHREDLSLPPAGRRDQSIPLPDLPFNSLQARLEPQDALAWDDRLELDKLQLTPQAVQLDALCPEALRRVLRSHPRLRLATTADQALPIHCGSRAEGAGLYFLTPGQPHAPDALPAFTPPWPPLQADWLQLGNADARGDQVLLGTAMQPLISLHPAAPRRVTVYFDIARPALTRQPEYPVLINALLDTTLQRSLLDETFATDRPLAESHIAPLPLAGDRPAAALAGGRPVGLDRYPLLLALLLLSLDLVRTWRRAGVR